MKLLVGLGNPGAEYAHHRHNIGFMALDRIAETHRLPPWRKKFSGLVTEGDVDGVRVLLLKPQTYMNDSGRAVQEAARFHKLGLDDIVVLHDELDLAPAKLRVKTGGGNAGHNGLRSITAHMGNAYVRVRLGIGHPGSKDLVHHWVLGNFAKADLSWLEPMLEAIAKAASRLAAGQFERFQTDVALAFAPSSPAKDVLPPRTVVAETPKPAPRHPAGERSSKQQNAIAENLKTWMEAKKKREQP